ncbi:MAG: DUF3108 domain-containing protein [Proteobacteria bacterium]|nr:DUF3108 domain-containing protein [Pseudomonadota bacterium]
MMKVHRILSTGLSVAALCLGSALLLAQPTAAAEGVLKLGYDVYLGGINIFYFEAKLEREGDRYVISGGGKTKGFVRLVWRWAVNATAKGIVDGTGVVSRSYDVTTIRKQKHKLLRLAFKGSGAYSISRTPPDSPRKRKKRQLPSSIPADTLDPVSVSLAVADALARGGSCGGKFPIFDGNRRYDLIFKKVGEEYFSKPGFSKYSGLTHRCQFAMKRISGFRKKRAALRFWDEEKHEPPQIWLGRLKKGLPLVPVQFQAEFNLGYMIIYLSKAEYGGRSLLASALPAPK